MGFVTALLVRGRRSLQLNTFGLWLQLSLPLLPLLLRLWLRTKVPVVLGVGGVLWRRDLLVFGVTIAGLVWRRRARRRSHPRGTRVGTKAAITAAAGIKASVGSIRCQQRGKHRAVEEGKRKTYAKAKNIRTATAPMPAKATQRPQISHVEKVQLPLKPLDENRGQRTSISGI